MELTPVVRLPSSEYSGPFPGKDGSRIFVEVRAPGSNVLVIAPTSN